MEVLIKPDPAAATLVAAALVVDLIRRKPHAVLALPTGNTPLPLYRELIRRHREERLDFARVTTFNLDEYIGLPASHPGSFHHYMDQVLFQHVNLDPSRRHLPDGMSRDVDATCQAYEERIRSAGGLDLVILGIGTDGHIAFNEPGSSLGSRTRSKTLTARTRADNVAAFGALDRVPKQVITMGIQTIMEARQVLLLAFGARKAEIIARAVEGPITALVPASILQFHPAAVTVLDDAAAARLALLDEYRETAGR
ncbi:MAG: glucosamine-6-phosphate deaminase [Planctomycetota bacterium]